MLREPEQVSVYRDADHFIREWWGVRSYLEDDRYIAFNKVYPFDPVLDVENELEYRIERQVDEHGDAAVLVSVLNEMTGEYLLDVRSNAHESMFVVTKLKSVQ